MKKIIFLATVFMLTGFCLTATAQRCGDAVSIVAPYYSYEAGTKFGLGLEAGFQGVDSRMGYYAGFNYKQLATTIQKTDSSGFDYRSNLYIKGTFRLNEGPGTIFLVASPQLSLQSGMDFVSGLRFMYPLSGKAGIGAEPLYSIKNKTISVNFIFAF